MTPEGIAEARRKERMVLAIASYPSLRVAAVAMGVSESSLCKWRQAHARGGLDALMPASGNSGRKPMVEPSADESKALRKIYAATNAGRDRGSEVTAARLFAQSDACSEPLRHAILKPRSSKHSLPQSVRRAIRVPAAVVRHIRAPHAASLVGPHIPGWMRMTVDAGTGERRRLFAGERLSFDDGSMNFVLWVPWPWGGCDCSEKYQVKVGRFQLLAGTCDGYDFCPGASLVARPSQGYRTADPIGAMSRVFLSVGAPDRVILERGTWETHAMGDFLEAVGVGVEHVHSPHHKLVEGWWNRLWTRMSVDGPQIGRYRGEMEWETYLYLACRAGRKDPREHFWGIERAMAWIEECVRWLNSEPVESDMYGKWVPVEAWEDGMARRPMRRIDPDHAWAAAPERAEWTVRKNGMIGGRIPCPLGPSVDYHFAAESLHRYEGARCRVYFDPATSPVEATLVLADPYKGTPAGTLIARRVPCTSDAPMVARTPEGWRCSCRDGNLGDAMAARKAARNAVRTESFAITGRRTRARQSEIRDGWGNRAAAEFSTPMIQATEQRTTATGAMPAMDRAGGRRALPPAAADAEIEAAEADIARLEAEARARGDLLVR